MKSCAMRIVTLAVFAFIGLALSVWLNREAPIKPTVPFGQLPPEEQQRRKQAVNDLEAQVDALRDSARRREHRPFALMITNEELDTLLQESLGSGRYPVRGVQSEIRAGMIVVQGVAKLHGVDATANIGGTIVAANGALAFKVNSLLVQGLPAPNDWKEKAQSTVSERLNRELSSDGVNIKSVHLEAGIMTITGVTN